VAKKNASTLTTMELQQELDRREKGAHKLAAKRDRLIEQIAEIDAELEELGYEAETPAPTNARRNGRTARGGSRKRPKNDQPLTEVLQKVMKGKTMGVTEAAEAAQNAGYRSSSASFRNIVNQTLLKHPDLFKKIERGQYTAK